MPIVRNGTDEIGDPLFEVTDILQLDMSKRVFLPDITLLSFILFLPLVPRAWRFILHRFSSYVTKFQNQFRIIFLCWVECCELFLIHALLQLDSHCVQMFSI